MCINSLLLINVASFLFPFPLKYYFSLANLSTTAQFLSAHKATCTQVQFDSLSTDVIFYAIHVYTRAHKTIRVI